MSLLTVAKQVKDAGEVSVPDGDEVPVQIARKTPPKQLSPALQALRAKAAEKKAEGKPVGKRAVQAAKKREVKKAAKQEKAKAKTAARVAAGGPRKPLCACGCKEETKYRDAEFLRGHYARYIGMLKNVARGDNAWEDLSKQVQLRVKTMQNLGKIIKDHDERCKATTKSGGAFKTKWLKKQQAAAKREKAAKAAAKGKK